MTLNRRKFLKLSAATGTSTLIGNLDSFSKPIQKINSMAGFKLLIYATDWGYSGSWDAFCSKIKEAGYDYLWKTTLL